MASEDMIPTVDAVVIEVLNVDWQACRATLKLLAYPGHQCNSVKIHLTEHIKATVPGDSIFVIGMNGQSVAELIFNVEFASNDTSAIHGVLFADVPFSDSGGGPLFGAFAFYFINSSETQIASQENPWQVPINLGPPPRRPHMTRLPDGTPPPAGAKILGPLGNRNKTMDELRQSEQWPLDPYYYMEIEIADGKLWRRYLKEYTFFEVPNSEDTVAVYLAKFARESAKLNAENDARAEEKMAKKRHDKSWGISMDSMSVLERRPLEDQESEMIRVEGRTFGRVRGQKEFLEAISVTDSPRNHQPFLLDLRDSEQHAAVSSIIDSLFDTRKSGFYWAWLDSTKCEKLLAAGISFEPYWGPRISVRPKRQR